MAESGTAHHAGVVVANVKRHETRLFHLLLLERVIVPAVLLLVIALDSGLGRSFWVTLGLLFWTVVTSTLMWRSLRLLRAVPALLLVDVGVAVGVFLFVGSWRGDFFYVVGEPVVVAAVFASAIWALALAGAGALVISVSLGAFGLPDGRGVVVDHTVQDWLNPSMLLVVAAMLVAFIRRLLDELDRFGTTYKARAEELDKRHSAVAEYEGRQRLVPRLHDDLRQLFPAFRLRLGSAREATDDRQLAGDLAELDLLASEADENLNDILLELKEDEFVPPIREDDGGGANELANAVDAERQTLFRAVVIARFIFAVSIAAYLHDEAPLSRFGVIVAWWLMLMIWVIATTLFYRRLYPLLRRRPEWLVLELLVGLATLIFATNATGNVFWTQAATAAVLSAVVARWPLTVALGLATIVGSVVSVLVANAAAWQALPTGPGLFATSVGYIGLIAPALYLQFLFNRLQGTSERFASDTRELHILEGRHAALAEQARVGGEVIDTLTPFLPRLRTLLTETATHATQNERVLSDLAAASSFLAKINDQLGHLDDLSDDSATAVARSFTDIVTSACKPVIALGATLPTTHLSDATVSLDAPIATALELLVREAVTNAWKHGKPPIEVDGHVTATHVEVRVRDHGSWPEPSGSSGVGIVRGQRVAAALGGTFVVTVENEGTAATVILPREESGRG